MAATVERMLERKFLLDKEKAKSVAAEAKTNLGFGKNVLFSKRLMDECQRVAEERGYIKDGKPLASRTQFQFNQLAYRAGPSHDKSDDEEEADEPQTTTTTPPAPAPAAAEPPPPPQPPKAPKAEDLKKAREKIKAPKSKVKRSSSTSSKLSNNNDDLSSALTTSSHSSKRSPKSNHKSRNAESAAPPAEEESQSDATAGEAGGAATPKKQRQKLLREEPKSPQASQQKERDSASNKEDSPKGGGQNGVTTKSSKTEQSPPSSRSKKQRQKSFSKETSPKSPFGRDGFPKTPSRQKSFDGEIIKSSSSPKSRSGTSSPRRSKSTSELPVFSPSRNGLRRHRSGGRRDLKSLPELPRSDSTKDQPSHKKHHHKSKDSSKDAAKDTKHSKNRKGDGTKEEPMEKQEEGNTNKAESEEKPAAAAVPDPPEPKTGTEDHSIGFSPKSVAKEIDDTDLGKDEGNASSPVPAAAEKEKSATKRPVQLFDGLTLEAPLPILSDNAKLPSRNLLYIGAYYRTKKHHSDDGIVLQANRARAGLKEQKNVPRRSSIGGIATCRWESMPSQQARNNSNNSNLLGTESDHVHRGTGSRWISGQNMMENRSGANGGGGAADPAPLQLPTRTSSQTLAPPARPMDVPVALPSRTSSMPMLKPHRRGSITDADLADAAMDAMSAESGIIEEE